MNPNDLKVGMFQCVVVHEDEKRIDIIVPEDWKVSVMTTDSWQTLDVERHGPLAGKPANTASMITATPRRFEPKP